MENNYFEFIPPELIDIICLYLNYTESVVLSSIFDIKVNFQFLLSDKYPAFYQIVKVVKEKDIKYRNYSYDSAYDLINLVEIYALSKSIIINFRSENLDIIYEIRKNNIYVENIMDILGSYIIINKKGKEYVYKYKPYFPNIKYGEESFNLACSRYTNDLESEIDYYNRTVDFILRQSALCSIFLFVLINKKLINEYKDKIINFKLLDYNNIDIIIREKIILQYIINFINSI